LPGAWELDARELDPSDNLPMARSILDALEGRDDPELRPGRGSFANGPKGPLLGAFAGLIGCCARGGDPFGVPGAVT
jgi:hypothetical protein